MILAAVTTDELAPPHTFTDAKYAENLRMTNFCTVPPHIADWSNQRRKLEFERELRLERAMFMTRKDPLLQQRIFREEKVLRAEPVSATIALAAFNATWAVTGSIAIATVAATLAPTLALGAVAAGQNYSLRKA